MPALPAQQYIFKSIKERLPATASIVDVVASLLYVSTDSAYRRIRCETPLTLDESKILCEHFKLSLDQLLQLSDKSVLFQSQRIDAAQLNFENYLRSISEHFNYLQNNQCESLIYLTKDIPLFHTFCFKPLFAFRYFFWMKSILQHPDFKDKKFSLDCLPQHIEELGCHITKQYNNVSSTEIWNTECINSTIFQINFYKEAGYISSYEEIDCIYDGVIQAIDHLAAQAEAGAKFLPGESSNNKPTNFNFFHNRIVLGDNTILVKMPHTKISFINYDVLNYIYTTDDHFCNDIDTTFKNLIKRSTLISTENEKQRYSFFHTLQEKVYQRKKQLY